MSGDDVEGALLDAIYDRPDDDAARAVYADWLQQRGDVRGEFIALQLIGPRCTAEQAKRERSLYVRQRSAIGGPLDRVLTAVEFRRGFPCAGTAVFRDERESDEVRDLRAWATIEDLDYTALTDRIEDPWKRMVSPAMTGLRTVTFPNTGLVLAATAPWRFEMLWLDLLRAQFRELVDGPLVPHLRHLGIRGADRTPPDPSWLSGVTRCPPQLTMLGVSLRDDVSAWLAAARPLPLDRLTLMWWASWPIHAHFTRDPTGAFTRLALELRFQRKDRSNRPVEYVIGSLQALPPGLLTHVEARVVTGFRTDFAEHPLAEHVTRELPEIVEAGAAIVRAT